MDEEKLKSRTEAEEDTIKRKKFRHPVTCSTAVTAVTE